MKSSRSGHGSSTRKSPTTHNSQHHHSTSRPPGSIQRDKTSITLASPHSLTRSPNHSSQHPLYHHHNDDTTAPNLPRSRRIPVRRAKSIRSRRNTISQHSTHSLDDIDEDASSSSSLTSTHSLSSFHHIRDNNEENNSMLSYTTSSNTLNSTSRSFHILPPTHSTNNTTQPLYSINSPFNQPRRHFFSFNRQGNDDNDDIDRNNNSNGNNNLKKQPHTHHPSPHHTIHRPFSSSQDHSNNDSELDHQGDVKSVWQTINLKKIDSPKASATTQIKDIFTNFGSRIEFERSTVDPQLQMQLQKWREFGEKYREKEILMEIEMNKNKSTLKEISNRVFGPFIEPFTDADLYGHYPDHIGTRHEFSNLQPLIFSSNEFPSFLKEDTNKFLEKTGLKRYTDMIGEGLDDIVDHLNKSEPFGQRPKNRKYRLRNKLNRPYARYSIDEMENEMREEQSKFHDLEADYWIQRDQNERKSLELKRKARRAMGLEPDLHLEERWAQMTSEAPAGLEPPEHVQKRLVKGEQSISDFERFRAEYKAKEDVYNEGGKKDDEETEDEHDAMGRNIKKEAEKRARKAFTNPKFRPSTYDPQEALQKARKQHGIDQAQKLIDDLDKDSGDDDDSDGGDEALFNKEHELSKQKRIKKLKKKLNFFDGKDENDEGDYYNENNDLVDEEGNPIKVKRSSLRERQGKRDFSGELPGGPSDRDETDDEDPKYDHEKSIFVKEIEKTEVEKLQEAEEKKDPSKNKKKREPIEQSLDTLVQILHREQKMMSNEDGKGIMSGWYRLKPRRLIHDEDGLLVPRDDLFGYPVEYINAMPADEEDMNGLEREHWKRRVRQANHRKYFKHGWKYELRWGMGPKYSAPEMGYIDNSKVREGTTFSNFQRAPQRKTLTHFGFQGLGAPRVDSSGGPSGIYDYIYGRPLPQMTSHGGILSIDLFREFPSIFRTHDPRPWTGTTALTYDPLQNQTTRWELRRQTLKYKLSMSPLGDMTRWAWKMFNIDVFPLTHFRYPFGWIMGNVRWAMGFRHALARWSKTAGHLYIDQRFAYQSNRYGENQNKDIYHYINEYDYLKEYQLPIVLRAIREYDFDVLRSACTQHTLFNILKWLHIQDRFGVYFESRRNYWVESLDIRDVRKNENGHLILDVEFAVIEPPYYYNRAGGKIFSNKAQYQGFYRPSPLIIQMSLLRDYEHPDFDYQVIDFTADARRIKRVFNNIERMYHSAQRSRTQYWKAPKFYAVRRTGADRSYYSRRTMVVGAYHSNLENLVFDEKELDFQEDMEDRYSEMIKYRESTLMIPYLTALELEPLMDKIVAENKQHPAYGLHPIQKDAKAYWEQRKELDLIKFRQREARRVRAQQNTLHRYFHKLRAVAHYKHTLDHGGDLHEFRRLHIDKLAMDANHDDWVQKWFVDPERRGRPYFKNIRRFAIRAKRFIQRKGRKKFHGRPKGGVDNTAWHGYRQQRVLTRFRKFTKRFRMRHRPGSGKRRQRKRWRHRTRKGGHNMRRRHFRKRRRFMPYMERVYMQLPRGAFWESKKYFRVRNHRINAFKGNTTVFSPKHKGPGYSMYDTSHHERWHVWDGGYYNPHEACWTRADVFNPANQPFEPRRLYAYAFLEDHTLQIPMDPHRDWDMPWRITNPPIDSRKGLRFPMFLKDNLLTDQKLVPDYLQTGQNLKMARPKFGDLPNAEVYSLNDDEQYQDYEKNRQWPVPQDDKWKI